LLEFKNLQRISLVKCGIDDAALQGLKGLTKLSFLDVSGNPKVTDGCIDTLSTIKTLSTLNASDTGITSVGEEKLKEALPDCNVTIKAASAEPAK
jgi:Leucine-rich repeat (LRR) protein